MRLSAEQLARYRDDGFLVLSDFVETSACERLRARAKELVHEFDPSGVTAIFSTKEQNRLADDYFLESGDKIRFFFEAILIQGTPEGKLRGESGILPS